MADLNALEDWAGALLAKLSPTERRQLNQGIARNLRRSQQQRIALQQNPDGTPFAPRRSQKALRGKKGRIRRRMFTKLRTAKLLKMQSNPNAIAIGFLGRTARIARIHQYGLKDRPERGQRDVQYDRRELLGFTPAELDSIRDQLLEHLTR